MEQISSSKSRIVDFKSIQFPLQNFIPLLSKDGTTKLHTSRYPAVFDEDYIGPKVPKASIVFFHGYGSYVNKFGFIA